MAIAMETKDQSHEAVMTRQCCESNIGPGILLDPVDLWSSALEQHGQLSMVANRRHGSTNICLCVLGSKQISRVNILTDLPLCAVVQHVHPSVMVDSQHPNHV